MKHIIVPSPGYTLNSLMAVANAQTYEVLGPFTPGTWIDRCTINVYGPEQVLATVGMVFSATGKASQSAYQSGRSVFTKSTTIKQKRPALVFANRTFQESSLDLPIGVRVDAYSRFIIVAMSSGAVTLAHVARIGIFVLEIRKLAELLGDDES